MDKKQTDAIAIRQRLQPCDDLIIVGIAVVIPSDFPHLLKRVDNDKGSVWVLPQKIGELLVEAAAECDEALMDKYFEDPESITDDEIIAAIRKGTISMQIVPACCGSSFKNRSEEHTSELQSQR